MKVVYGKMGVFLLIRNVISSKESLTCITRTGKGEFLASTDPKGTQD